MTRKKLSATERRDLAKLLLASVFEPQAIGERLAQARNEAGLTQEEAADLVGVSTRSLQSYEAGTVMPYRHMRKFGGAYKKPIEWLLHGEAEPTARDERLDRIEAQLSEIRDELRQVHEQLRTG